MKSKNLLSYGLFFSLGTLIGLGYHSSSETAPFLGEKVSVTGYTNDGEVTDIAGDAIKVDYNTKFFYISRWFDKRLVHENKGN